MCLLKYDALSTSKFQESRLAPVQFREGDHGPRVSIWYISPLLGDPTPLITHKPEWNAEHSFTLF